MNQRVFVAWFDDEHAVLDATREARRAGFSIHDVYTPFAVHGMDEAMGLRPSRLTWVCFVAGVLGLSCGLGLEYYASAVSWPINVGGKPFNSFPAFIPVAFETTVLFAALFTVAALFVRLRLRPRLDAGDVLARVTDDRFALCLVTAEGGFSEHRAKALAARHHAVETSYAEVRR
ncbi:MAG: DUF3341 domain-containing protein [Byssovorax sp.]